MSSSVYYRPASRATVYFHVPCSPYSWCMHSVSLVLSGALHSILSIFPFSTGPAYTLGWTLYVFSCSTFTKWPVTPLAGLLPLLITRWSPSTFLLATSVCRWRSVLLSTHDAYSPPICVGLFAIVCADGPVMVLSLCGLNCPCYWAGQYHE